MHKFNGIMVQVGVVGGGRGGGGKGILQLHLHINFHVFWLT